MSERRRRIVRALVIGLAGAAVLVLGASLLLRIGGERALERERTAFVDRWGPVDAAAFQRPAVAEERNAAAWIKAGAAAIVWSNADRTLIQRLSVHPAQEWSEEQRTAVLEVVEGNRAAIELLGRAVGLSGQRLGYRVEPSGAAELWVEDLQELLREIGVPSASVDATTPIRLPAP